MEVSAREAEVLAALGEHLTNAEIAARLVISVRTVESHVSSLLRKLGAPDRRALAALAADRTAARGPSAAVPSTLPTSLTPFVGRSRERAELAAALREHRLVTAVGPGGVGKTRLALSVAADLAGTFADGVWYVDLVPVTDAAMIAPAIAARIGLGERAGASAADDVAAWLAGRECLVVLDNCEHLLDGVVVLMERLLAAGPGLRVLATSRARLLVPFERVFLVPGLGVDLKGEGDAVELFLGRVAAGGAPVPDVMVGGPRIAAICAALDGMALAIELAAARYPSLGLDGLESGLGDRLRLLTGGSRLDDRHRSLRSTLDWSHALLSEPDRALLRRVSTFAAPFTASAAAAVTGGWPPVEAADVPGHLAGLADQSLLAISAAADGTRYRALETIRQYGADRLAEAGEAVQARERHLRWALDQAQDLETLPESGTATGHGATTGSRPPTQSEDATESGGWRGRFDLVADELRAALAWAAAETGHQDEAYRLATRLAHLLFVRGFPREAQGRYEQAAGLAEAAGDDAGAAVAWRAAAGAAAGRHVGTEALRLLDAAVEAALRAGDRAGAASDLALNAELIGRGPGLMAALPPPGQAARLLARARELAGDDLRAWARIATAEAFDHDESEPATAALVEHAVDLARQAGAPEVESAALDQRTAIELAHGDVRAAAATSLRRTELLAPVAVTATTALEIFDGLMMATECAVAAGRLDSARHLAERLRDLPFYREEGHLATGRLLLVTVLAGDWDEARGLAVRFREGWERAGRPRAGNLTRGAYAAAMMYGLSGDEGARADWLDVVHHLRSPGELFNRIHVDEFFDAMLLLHQGRAGEATRIMDAGPEELDRWFSGLWRPWYAALWAESAVLAGRDDVDDRLARAATAATGNPIAAAVVQRASALTRPEGERRAGLTAAATALRSAGCRYQWARTLVMLGGERRAEGEAVLAAMGTTPMAWPR